MNISDLPYSHNLRGKCLKHDCFASSKISLTVMVTVWSRTRQDSFTPLLPRAITNGTGHRWAKFTKFQMPPVSFGTVGLTHDQCYLNVYSGPATWMKLSRASLQDSISSISCCSLVAAVIYGVFQLKKHPLLFSSLPPTFAQKCQ